MESIIDASMFNAWHKPNTFCKDYNKIRVGPVIHCLVYQNTGIFSVLSATAATSTM